MRAGLLDVVTVISNPVRYQSRWRLYREFAQRIWKTGARLITVELAYGERPFEVTNWWSPNHVRVRLEEADILWHKENLIDIGFARSKARYVAWVDADVEFQRKDWASETVEALQHYQAVQLFSTAQDLGPDGDLVGRPKAGFMQSYVNGKPPSRPRYDGADWHPGYAWAIRRDAYERLGGMVDFAVLGSGDRHMAMSLVGKAELSYPRNVSPYYKDKVLAWEELAENHIRRNVGYVPGALYHHWHGRKSQRGYEDRWLILIEEEYNPNRDIRYRMDNGVIQWSHHQDSRQQRLRDRVRLYMRSRNEDSIDLV